MAKNKSTRRHYQQAWSPYNFVPMPDKPLYAELQKEHDAVPGDERLQRHDCYSKGKHTGYFRVRLKTETPLFIRGMLTITEQEAEKEMRKHADFFGLRGKPPVIPGSSLRGMLRTLVEIVTKSKMHFVSDANPMFFRAVAADKTDPLKYPYEQIIGKFSRNVRAGYLTRKGGRWYVQPAHKIGQSYFAKVKDWNKKNNYSPVEGVEGIIRLNEANYKVQYHPVAYSAKGDFVSRVYTPKEEQDAEGVLVCTGNMAETQSGSGRVNSPRKNYTLVAHPNLNAKRLPIPQQIINDYLEGLSAFQKEDPFHKDYGVLKEERPIFYVEEGGQVIHFGHTPNFRVAPQTVDENVVRAKNPKDLVPPALRKQNPTIDYAEAMFGYVSEQEQERTVSAYAGRISVTSAYVTQERDSYIYDPITLRVLASPKPTTFQHYLEQPNGIHTPTNQLKHYGDNTVIRGHKLYWRHRIQGLAQVQEPDPEKTPETSTQHTLISPVREGVEFEFKVHFENLSNVELGALLWVLTLGGDTNARHQMGMGKPFGLGVVQLQSELILTKRRLDDGNADISCRYRRLFDANGRWERGEEIISTQEQTQLIDMFKREVNFDQEQRFRELMTLLQMVAPQTMQGLQPDKQRAFDYMKIESDNGNDYQGRPVLPRPSEIENGVYDD